MTTATTILSIWLIAAAGVQLGTLWIMKLSILPMLNALPYDRYANTCQLIDMHVFHPIALWNGILGAGVGIFLAALSPSALTHALFVVGSVAMVVVGATSEGVNRPIWRQIEKWDPMKTVNEWARKRYRWHVAHQVRTYAAVGAVGAYGGAVILVQLV